MILRIQFLAILTQFLLLLPLVSAQNPFDCHVSYENSSYDLTALKGEHTVSRTRSTPPTEMVDTVTFNLCEDLHKQEGVADADQCPEGTRACLTKTNHRGDEGDRIVAVIPLGVSSNDVEHSRISSPSKGLSLTLKGASYPASDAVAQSFNLNLLCELEVSDPVFSSYTNGELWIQWGAPAGCEMGAMPDEEPDKGGDDGDVKEEPAMGSGVGYFFLLLFLAFVAYFALGAYYNYSTYGASGTDLIPHRDFWREVPYMLRDLVSHIYSSVRPRHTSSRGGYIAV